MNGAHKNARVLACVGDEIYAAYPHSFYTQNLHLFSNNSSLSSRVLPFFFTMAVTRFQQTCHADVSSIDSSLSQQTHMHLPVTRTSFLSQPALLLLHRTCRIIRKQPHQKHSSILQPLLQQLASLRRLVPRSSSNADSCVISDALTYLDDLTQQLADLTERLSQVSDLSLEHLSPCPKVQVLQIGQAMRIHVSCQKRSSLMTDLLAAVESIGLVFEDVNVSNHQNFVLDAVCTQVAGEHACIAMVKSLLIRTILCLKTPT